MHKIIALTDYKGVFGSKWNAKPYRSGMQKNLLKQYFSDYGYEFQFIKFSDVDFRDDFSNNDIVLYTSSEDIGLHYKDYIEDIVLGFQEMGAHVIPDYKFLRANNNKVFMEILRNILFNDEPNNLSASYYGTLEDIIYKDLSYPQVVKQAAGAMGRGVFKAGSKRQLLKKLKKTIRTIYIKNDIKDYLRAYKHKDYIKESLYRKKFISQDFIPNLKSDYKILIFGQRYYIFERPVRKDDFRASGSGNKNYIYGSKVDYPDGIFDYAKDVFQQSNVPHLSIDIAFDGKQFYLLEFQAVYFGTVGHEKSDGFYIQSDEKWVFQNRIIEIEKVFVDAIIDHVNSNKFNGN